MDIMGILALVGGVEVLGCPDPQVDPFVVGYGDDSGGGHVVLRVEERSDAT